MSSIFARSPAQWRKDNARFWSSVSEFYHTHSIDAWDNNVPFYITNNPDFAHQNAKLIVNYMIDCKSQGYQGEFILMECGAGLGQFAFLFLNSLFSLLDNTNINPQSFKYVLCDYSEKTISFWKNQPQLAPFFANGMLCSSQLYIDEELSVHCNYDTESLHNKRVILLSNYCFDSLYQSPFILEKSRFVPCRIIQKANILSSSPLQLKFKPVKDSPPPYSDCDVYNRIVDSHLQLGAQQTLMPDGPIALIQWLDQQTAHPLLIICSDKGFTGFNHGHYGECFSLVNTGTFHSCVNFLALNSYVAQALHGSGLLAPEDQVSFGTNIFLTEDALQKYPALSSEVTSSLQSTGTLARSRVCRLLYRATTIEKVDELLNIFAETRYDSFILTRLFTVLESHLQNSESLVGTDIDKILQAFYKNYYFTPHESSLVALSNIINFSLLVKRFEFAEALLDLFLQWHGKDYHYHRLSGLFYFLQSDFTSAAHFFTASLQDNPDCPTSQSFLDHCKSLM